VSTLCRPRHIKLLLIPGPDWMMKYLKL
jgi:hypothetical protein